MTATLVAVLLCGEIKSSFRQKKVENQFARISRLRKLQHSFKTNKTQKLVNRSSVYKNWKIQSS